jgi:hypothetical protein
LTLSSFKKYTRWNRWSIISGDKSYAVLALRVYGGPAKAKKEVAMEKSAF